MEKDLLQAIIKVESEIQQAVESERKKAAEWLESVRISLSQELEIKKQQLDSEYTRSLEITCQQCEFQAKKEIDGINEMADNLQNLSENILQELVRGYIQEILPEKQG
jgi:hypothetical protein